VFIEVLFLHDGLKPISKGLRTMAIELTNPHIIKQLYSAPHLVIYGTLEVLTKAARHGRRRDNGIRPDIRTA
jgi:hypothetical protein